MPSAARALRLSPTCQAITSSNQLNPPSALRRRPATTRWRAPAPATIHPRRVPMRSLSNPGGDIGKAGHHRTEERHLRQHRGHPRRLAIRQCAAAAARSAAGQRRPLRPLRRARTGRGTSRAGVPNLARGCLMGQAGGPGAGGAGLAGTFHQTGSDFRSLRRFRFPVPRAIRCSTAPRHRFGNRLIDRGERWLGEAHDRGVVEGDQRKVARHIQSRGRARPRARRAPIWSLLAMIAVRSGLRSSSARAALVPDS